jgi:hypothetical protein
MMHLLPRSLQAGLSVERWLDLSRGGDCFERLASWEKRWVKWGSLWRWLGAGEQQEGTHMALAFGVGLRVGFPVVGLLVVGERLGFPVVGLFVVL